MHMKMDVSVLIDLITSGIEIPFAYLWAFCISLV